MGTAHPALYPSDCVLLKKLLKERVETVTPKSGAFLGLSCVAAIAAIGSIFELSSGVPDLGTPVTSAILALSVPLAVLAFYLAVKDAKANQEE